MEDTHTADSLLVHLLERVAAGLELLQQLRGDLWGGGKRGGKGSLSIHHGTSDLLI